jgi:ABC-type protease/lipase transport system fused ATPase/permease subunit
MKIRPIHPFGPAVGKWKSHGTVAETFARIKRELQQAEQQSKAVVRKRS